MAVTVSRRGVLAGLLATLGLAACSPGGEAPAPAAGTPAPMRIDYGSDPSQYGELHLPAGAGTHPVVVVLHGGFWRAAYGLDLGTPLAVDLANAGLAAWNVEYRRVGNGGGFPATLDDVAAAVDLLPGGVQAASGGRLDLARVVLLGHSAGGHLAVWAASRERLPDGAPGARPAVRPRGAVSQAGVVDLVAAADQGVGGSATQDLLGGAPAAVPDRYAVASPAALVPAPVPVVCVHGTADANVPLDQSERYVAAATAARATARLRVLDDVDHFALIDPSTPAWAAVREEVVSLL